MRHDKPCYFVFALRVYHNDTEAINIEILHVNERLYKLDIFSVTGHSCNYSPFYYCGTRANDSLSHDLREHSPDYPALQKALEFAGIVLAPRIRRSWGLQQH